MVFIGIVFILSILWFQHYTLPLPNLSNSISLNAKVEFLKTRGGNNNANVMSIGSSYSLNNINSNAICKNYGVDQYLNMSSWGLNIEEVYYLFKIYSKIYKPGLVIISSNYGDFCTSRKKIKYKKISEFLKSEDYLYCYVNEWNFKQSILDSREFGLYKNDKTNYQSLMFDNNGGVNYPAKNFKINSKRWDGGNITKHLINEAQYSFLDSIASFCYVNNIKLVYVISPFREGYYQKLGEEELEILYNHNKKVNKILSPYGMFCINSLEKNWNDSLFVDYSHLSEEGSYEYTKYFLEQLELMNELAISKK